MSAVFERWRIFRPQRRTPPWGNMASLDRGIPRICRTSHGRAWDRCSRPPSRAHAAVARARETGGKATPHVAIATDVAAQGLGGRTLGYPRVPSLTTVSRGAPAGPGPGW